jgi:hypothetical protein
LGDRSLFSRCRNSSVSKDERYVLPIWRAPRPAPSPEGGRHQARVAQHGGYGRHVEDALAEIEEAVIDHLARIENALADDKAEAEYSGEAERTRRAYFPHYEAVPMPARPIWRGHLRLALISCPIALWNAKHGRTTIRFNMINPETGNRIRMKTVDAETDQEVQRRDLVKGYESRNHQYILISDADFDSAKSKARR